MAFEKISTDLSFISKLADEPNDVGGLSAAELKAEFDKAGNALKTYINQVLLPFLEGSGGAGSIGMEPVPGLTGVSNIQAAFEKVEQQMAEITQGSVADGSITSAKLSANALENYLKIGSVKPTETATLWFDTSASTAGGLTEMLLTDDTNSVITAYVEGKEYGVSNASANQPPQEGQYDLTIL